MSDPDRHHLSDEEAWLAASQGTAWGQEVSPLDIRWAKLRTHLENCPDCRSRVKQEEKASMSLKRIGPLGKTVRGTTCPPEAEWSNLAAGIVAPDQALLLLAHVEQCDYCGSLLRQGTEDFAGEVTIEEQNVLSQMKSGQAEWQREMARTLSAAHTVVASPSAPRGRWWGLPAWGYAAVAAIVVLAVGLAIWQLRPQPAGQAARLLAQAYSEQRRWEFRYPGAAHAPRKSELRGTERSRRDKSPSLPEAESLIRKELSIRPNDPVWVSNMARIDLLEGNYDAAIDGFQSAADLGGESAALLLSLATAFYERAANVPGREMDFGRAHELLGRALASAPSDPVIVFNLAIASERLHLYREAERHWQKYLQLEPNGLWAEEARRRREELRKKLSQWEQRAPRLLTRPEEFRLALEGDHAGTSTAVRARADDYLDVALRQWLPQAFPERGGVRGTAAEWALDSLARLLAEGNDDPWLRDLLAGMKTPAFGRGARSLSQAVSAGAQGRYAEALDGSREAARLFQTAGNHAGVLRARLQEVYSLHRSTRARDCLIAASALRTQLGAREYPWLKIQLVLEESNCLKMAGNLGRVFPALQSAVVQSRHAGFSSLALRALAFSGGAEKDRGRLAKAWALQLAGLQLYWETRNPPIRAYAFYYQLADLAAILDWKLAAVALQSEAVATIAQTENRANEAMARSLLATLAWSVGDHERGRREWENGNRLFSELPQSEANRIFQEAMQLDRAAFEAEFGDAQKGRSMLRLLHPRLPKMEAYNLPLRYYQALGIVASQQGDSESAEKALLAAVGVAEWGLSTLRDNRDRLTWSQATAKVYRGLTRLRSVQKGQTEKALETWEWFKAAPLRMDQHHGYQNGSRRPEVLDFANLEREDITTAGPQVRDHLPQMSQETVLTYAVVAGGVLVWSFDDRGVVSKWIPDPQGTLRRAARRFTELCADPSSNRKVLGDLGRQLYEALVAPMSDRLSPERALQIEPDGALAELPWQALPLPSGSALGLEYSFSLSPGFWVRENLRRSGPISTEAPLLAVGAPAPAAAWADSFPLLPDAGREARGIAARFHKPSLLLGSQATPDALLRELSRTTVFHFAGHGVIESTRAGLLLAPPREQASADDALLTVDRLEPARLSRCRLVVLSACATERGPEGGFLDPAGLVTGFLYAGIPHVVASRWRVDSAATASFMETFYESLTRGEPVTSALRAAARRIRSDPATGHPYYWAAFTTYGRS